MVSLRSDAFIMDRKNSPAHTVRRSALAFLCAASAMIAGCGSNAGNQPAAFPASNTSGVAAPSLLASQRVLPPAHLDSATQPNLDILLGNGPAGRMVPVVFDQQNQQQKPAAFRNGSRIPIEVQTDRNVTVVMVDTGLAVVDLTRVGPGDWRGSFQYADESNWGDPRSKITLRISSPLDSVEKTIAVTTVHDL
ncbi:MAG: hypothetical protein DLM53_08680 [Candidatus Eremiobacter antarcticus]|nr:MAG: hypothetical protein DLM53_08680 [Candidatus Eremiobacter sp. RRmetagenome_bin22]